MIKGIMGGLVLWALVFLPGCTGVQLPITKGSADFEDGQIKKMAYESTKAQSGFHGEVDPKTGRLVVDTDKADSPRGYESYIEAQTQVELRRLELYDKMFDAALSGAKSAAPVPVP